MLVLLAMIYIASAAAADGLIVVPPPDGPVRPFPPRPPWRGFPLQVKYHRVDVSIEDLSAETRIDQVFYNPTGQRLEGYYIFPVPRGAVIDKFSLYMDGREVEAEMLTAEKARRIYEDIVRRAKDPALLEYYNQDLFKARIFPLEPHSERRIKISYRQILERDNGTIEYVYPLNTEKFSSAPIDEVVINVDIRSRERLKNVYSPSHQTEIVRRGDYRARAAYETRRSLPDKDFRLYFRTGEAPVGLSLLTYREPDEDGYFYLHLSPLIEVEEAEIEDKDITFVLDVSGSMDGDNLKKAKQALRFCIENLNRGDRFNVIRFSTEAEAWSTGLADATTANRREAADFIEGLQAIGGTNIEEALELALSGSGEGERPSMILFITDGKPTIGLTGEAPLIESLKAKVSPRTRIFTCGIGYDINTHLLDRITELTRSSRTYIQPDEEIEMKISNLYNKIRSPVLTGLEIKTGSGVNLSRIYPDPPPDLFLGSSLTLLGRYRGDGKTQVVLEGMLKGRKISYRYDMDFDRERDDNDLIPSLWASRRIGYLLDQIRLHGEDRELVEEVVDLARKHGIITPYTSYLIVEDERRHVAGGRLERDEQTISNMAPAGSGVLAGSERAWSTLRVEDKVEGVKASLDLRALNEAENTDQLLVGKEELGYRDEKGKAGNIIEQLRMIRGRAFYHTGAVWMDSAAREKGYQDEVSIRFASEEYYALLQKFPQAGDYLSLGKRVKFVMNQTLYEIME
ncbi:MAG: VWA domain-containing protein [Candidatus Krumholzibacteriota bacterium]|nr:VWA domain-containing protein [Candidatus Krumholzibacteriota bacterium]